MAAGPRKVTDGWGRTVARQRSSASARAFLAALSALVANKAAQKAKKAPAPASASRT